MAYHVAIDPAALRELKKLTPKVRQEVSAAISALATEPRPMVRKLTGSQNSYRIRVGDYRVLYHITDGALLVLIVKVAHRRDVYR